MHGILKKRKEKRHKIYGQFKNCSSASTFRNLIRIVRNENYCASYILNNDIQDSDIYLKKKNEVLKKKKETNKTSTDDEIRKELRQNEAVGCGAMLGVHTSCIIYSISPLNWSFGIFSIFFSLLTLLLIHIWKAIISLIFFFNFYP